jgi:regulator of chromosome condensation
VDAEETIIGVACGDGQTIVVSTAGNVWGWGCYIDKEGKKFFNPSQTAQSQVKDIKKQQNDPLLIQGLSNVAEVACGSAFNLALCDDGSVYSWGIGECGELARKETPLKQKDEYNLEGILADHITPGSMMRYKDDSNQEVYIYI